MKRAFASVNRRSRSQTKDGEVKGPEVSPPGRGPPASRAGRRTSGQWVNGSGVLISELVMTVLQADRLASAIRDTSKQRKRTVYLTKAIDRYFTISCLFCLDRINEIV